MTRLLVLTDVRGNKSVGSLVKTFSPELKIDLVILLGNIVAPNLIEDLAEAGLRVVGVAGNLDDASVIDAFKRHGFYAELKTLELGELRLFFLGTAFEESFRKTSIEHQNLIFFTHYPGSKHGCCHNGSVEIIDKIAVALNPLLVVTGKCTYPCFSGSSASPGRGDLGYALLIEHSEYLSLRFINLWDLLDQKLSFHKLIKTPKPREIHE